MKLLRRFICHDGTYDLVKLQQTCVEPFGKIKLNNAETHQLMMEMDENLKLEMMSIKHQIRQQMGQWIRKQMRQELSEFAHEMNSQVLEERSQLKERLQNLDNLRDKYDNIKNSMVDEQILINQKLQALSGEIRECRDELRSKQQSSSSELEASHKKFQNAPEHDLELERNQRQKGLRYLHENLKSAIQVEIKKIGQIQHNYARISQDLLTTLQEKFNGLESRFKQKIQTCMAVNSEQLAKQGKQIAEMFQSRIRECKQEFWGVREKLDEKQMHITKLENSIDKLNVGLNEGMKANKLSIQLQLKISLIRAQRQGIQRYNQLSKQLSDLKMVNQKVNYLMVGQICKLKAFLQRLNDEYQFSTLGPLLNQTQIVLKGKNIAKINPSLFNLKNLKHLCLSENNITVLPEDMGNLINLQILELSKNKIQLLPEKITDLSSLCLLNLSSNMITHIPISINKLKKLKQLDFGFNKISFIPNYFYLPSLFIFNIYLNKLKQIPQTLGRMKLLSSLNFNDNQISELPLSLFDLPLKGLMISGNKFTQVPKQIAHLTLLSVLDIGNKSIHKLPQWLFQPNKLTSLYANSFHPLNLLTLWIDGMGLTQLPENFSNLKNLNCLYMEKNNLVRLPKQFGELKQLKQLSLTVSADSEITLETLPISELTALTSLAIEYNKYRPNEETQKFTKLCQSRNIKLQWQT